MTQSAESGKTITVKVVRSRATCNPYQRRTLEALGLHHREMVKTFPDNPAVRGMIAKVCHLVEVL